MNLKRVFIFAACLMSVANLGFVDPGVIVGTMQMPITGGDGSAGNPYVAGSNLRRERQRVSYFSCSNLVSPRHHLDVCRNNTLPYRNG